MIIGRPPRERRRRSLGGLLRGRLRSLTLALSVLGSACVLSPSPDLPGAENDAGSPPFGSGGSSASGGAPSNGGTGGTLTDAGGQGGDSTCDSSDASCVDALGGADSSDIGGQAGGAP